MKKFLHEKIHIMVQLVFAGVKVIIQFSISWQGSAADLSLYQFSWRVKERRRPSDVTNLFNFLMRIFWLIQIFRICDGQYSKKTKNTFSIACVLHFIAISNKRHPGRHHTKKATFFLATSIKISVFSQKQLKSLQQPLYLWCLMAVKDGALWTNGL